jgi:hypothetical protein
VADDSAGEADLEIEQILLAFAFDPIAGEAAALGDDVDDGGAWELAAGLTSAAGAGELEEIEGAARHGEGRRGSARRGA